MKQLFKISILCSLMVVFACEDYLDVQQLTSITSGNYYATPEEAETSLVGVYDGLQKIWNDGVALPVAATVMSDETFGGTGAADGDGYPLMDEFDLSRSPGDVNIFGGNWAAYYKAIFRANTLIMNLDKVEWGLQEAKKPIIESEARFLRAYFYFDMVRMFGHIPLIIEPTTENVPQAEPDDVYKLITEDLLFAIENGRSTPYTNIARTEHGHANKWAAEALLARVFLYYTGYYGKTDLVGMVTKAQALEHVEDLIANGGFSLVPEYSDLWPAAATYEAAQRGDSIANNTYAGETNPEVIFAIKYTYTSDWNGNADGNHWMVMNGLRGAAWGPLGYGNGWGACTVVPSFYSNWDNDDDRKVASVMAIAEEGIGYTAANIKDVKEYTGYFTKKYTPTANQAGESIAQDVLGGVSFMISQFQDYFSIRYADVLLMAAELGSASALDYVNQVRTRAGVEPVEIVTKDVIFEERRLELAFEGHRYWDLLRYDNTLAYAASKVTFTGTVKTAGADINKVIDGQKLVAKKGLFQIPNNQITLSKGVLIQNAGWDN